jgi:hypothetical protein
MRFTCIALAAVALALAKPYTAPGTVFASTFDLGAETRTSTTSTTSSTSNSANGVIDFTPLPSPDGAVRGGTALTPRGDPTRCAAVRSGERAPSLVVVSCTPSEEQTFTFTAGEIRTSVELCVTAPDRRDNAVRPVTLEPCNGSPAQRWTASEAGEYRGYRGKCLTAAGPQRRLGTPVAVRGCMGRSDQRWSQHTVAAQQVPVDSLRLSAVALSLGAGTSARVNVVALDPDGRELDDAVVTWVSSDPHVAAVSADGVVTAVGAGTTTVVAMSHGRVKGVPVEVRGAQYAGLESGAATFGSAGQ